MFYGRHSGRRFAVYVPEDLVGEVRRAIDNGRALQDLLMQPGPLRVHGEFVITLRLASGTDRGNGTVMRSGQGRHRRAVVRQFFLLGCCH